MDKYFKIVEAHNFDGICQSENFVNLPDFAEKISAENVAYAINAAFGFGEVLQKQWKVVDSSYVLEPAYAAAYERVVSWGEPGSRWFDNAPEFKMPSSEEIELAKAEYLSGEGGKDV